MQDFIKKIQLVGVIEKKAEGWFKKAPHFSASAKDWIANNAWWLVLVGLIASVIYVLVTISSIATVLSFVSVVGGSAYYSGALAGWWTFLSVISLLLYVALIVISALAIKPLQAKQKYGWDLLFFGMLVNVAVSVAIAVLSFSVGSLVSVAIFAVLSGYILFEVRSRFVISGKKSKK